MTDFRLPPRFGVASNPLGSEKGDEFVPSAVFASLIGTIVFDRSEGYFSDDGVSDDVDGNVVGI